MDKTVGREFDLGRWKCSVLLSMLRNIRPTMGNTTQVETIELVI